MNFEAKYSIGDRIRYEVKRRENVVKDCPFCGGSCKMFNYLHELVDCPECEGDGSVIVEEDVVREAQATINEVRITTDYYGNERVVYQIGNSTYNTISEDRVLGLVRN